MGGRKWRMRKIIENEVERGQNGLERMRKESGKDAKRLRNESEKVWKSYWYVCRLVKIRKRC